VSKDNVIHVDFGGRGDHAGKKSRPPLSLRPPRAKQPVELESTAPAQTKDPLSDVYSVRDVAKLFGLTASRLRYWEKSAFIARSARVGDKLFYSFEDLISIRAAKELLDEGIALQSVRRNIEALRASLPRVARPLSALRIVAAGGSLLVRDDHGAYEPATGQLQLDFEVSALRDDVVRVLRRASKPSNFALAYQHYLEGCRLDEEESGFERAEAAYKRAVELDPSLSNAFTNLGNLMYRRGKLAEAEGYYARALQLDPDQPEAFYNLGFLSFERSDVAAAVLNFKRALQSDPSFADAHFNLAMALLEDGQREEAKGHFQTYLRLDPDSPWAETARRHLE
jgi:tetratricopeptide (TPR) repeat protein